MRKQIIQLESARLSTEDEHWLDLEKLACVEMTSEDAQHPIEAALVAGKEGGWRAAGAGEQTIRLLFDTPQNLSRIRLLFLEDQIERLQDFVLSWSVGGEWPYQEILRQEYHFSPPDTVRQLEDYHVNLEGVMAFELRIVPDKNNDKAVASLAALRLA
jgi:hypothetical protein